MELTKEEFFRWENRFITLLGMSGVGKTRLASILQKKDWFHYSADFRIGSHYLDEAILDNIKQQAMQISFLHDLLITDSIRIQNNITADHLKPVSSFLGKLGDPEKGGLALKEFKRRQRLHRQAEIAAMQDVPAFIKKAHDIYGFKHFINDAGGSVCELDEPSVLQTLAEHTLVIYIKATNEDEQALIQRAESSPKPLYYREDFLDEQLAVYMGENNISYSALIEPDEFVRWIFPQLFRARIPRYDAIANEYGVTITTDELALVDSEESFVELVGEAISRKA